MSKFKSLVEKHGSDTEALIAELATELDADQQRIEALEIAVRALQTNEHQKHSR